MTQRCRLPWCGLTLAVLALAHYRRHVARKDGVHGFEGGATVVRDAEEASDVILFGGKGVELRQPFA